MTKQLKEKDEQLTRLNDKLNIYTESVSYTHTHTTDDQQPTVALIQRQIEKYVNGNYNVIQKGRGENKEQPMTMKSFVDDIKQQPFYIALTTIEKRKYGMKWIKDMMSRIVRVETPKNRGCEIYIKKKQSHHVEK